MTNEVDGLSVLVTGGGTGIGAGIARRLASDGAWVTICGRTAATLLGSQGGGFVVAQDRLGPGRIHHCMRAIGRAEVAIEKMVKRLSERST